MGEKENVGCNSFFDSNQQFGVNGNDKEPPPFTSINLSSDESSSESEEAFQGTDVSLPSPLNRRTPGPAPVPGTGNNVCGSNSPKSKRKLVDGDRDNCTSSSSAANGSVAKKCIWTHADEVSLLCSMLQFTNKKGHYPKNSYDMEVLHDMVTESISFRFKSRLTKDQMMNKARSMRRRHFRILEMVENGKELTENEHAVFDIGNLIWVTKIKKKKKRREKAGEQENPEAVMEEGKEDRGGKSFSISSPGRHSGNSGLKVDNGNFSAATKISDGHLIDKEEDESDVLNFLTQLLVLSGNHGFGYSRNYLQTRMLLLDSDKRKAVADICNKIQKEERDHDFHRLEASLEIIKIFRSAGFNNL